MLRTALVILSLLLTLETTASVADTVYLDRRSRTVEKKNAHRCLVWVDAARSNEATIYLLDGKKLERGHYLVSDTMIRDGDVTFFDDATGDKRIEGRYVLGLNEGEWKRYYPGKGSELHAVIAYKNGKREGTSKSFYKSGELKRVEVIENDSLVKGQCFSKSGEEIAYTPFYTGVRFRGGIHQYLATRIRYPKKCIKEEIEGRVLVNFAVDKKGRIGEVEIIESVHRLLDREAVRAVKSLPRALPAMLDGELIEEWYTVPVKFQLE